MVGYRYFATFDVPYMLLSFIAVLILIAIVYVSFNSRGLVYTFAESMSHYRGVDEFLNWHNRISYGERPKIREKNFNDRQVAVDALQVEKDLLKENEMRIMDDLILQYRGISQPIDPKIKDPLRVFTTSLNQYKVLLEKLNTVQLALQENRDIDDELIAHMTAEKPILLVKQYQPDGKKWSTVPATSYITCKDGILRWFLGCSMHPFNRDDFLQPNAYNEKRTRYVWHDLTHDNCLTPELSEAAQSLRAKLPELQSNLDVARRESAVVGLVANSVFGPVAGLNASSADAPDLKTEPRP